MSERDEARDAQRQEQQRAQRVERQDKQDRPQGEFDALREQRRNRPMSDHRYTDTQETLPDRVEESKDRALEPDDPVLDLTKDPEYVPLGSRNRNDRTPHNGITPDEFDPDRDYPAAGLREGHRPEDTPDAPKPQHDLDRHPDGKTLDQDLRRKGRGRSDDKGQKEPRQPDNKAADAPSRPRQPVDQGRGRPSQGRKQDPLADKRQVPQVQQPVLAQGRGADQPTQAKLAGGSNLPQKHDDLTGTPDSRRDRGRQNDGSEGRVNLDDGRRHPRPGQYSSKRPSPLSSQKSYGPDSRRPDSRRSDKKGYRQEGQAAATSLSGRLKGNLPKVAAAVMAPLIIFGFAGLLLIGAFIGAVTGGSSSVFSDRNEGDEEVTASSRLECTMEGGSGGLGAPDDWHEYIHSAAAESGVPADILDAQLRQESGYNPQATSPVGAAGPAQFMPATWAAYGEGDIRDPEDAIAAQGRYMKAMMDYVEARSSDKNEQVKLALAAYNAGPGNVDKYEGVPPFAETQGYIEIILGNSEIDFTEECEVTEARQVSATGTGEWTHPMPGSSMTSGYGYRGCFAGVVCNQYVATHHGVDFSSGGAATIVAPTDMEVTATKVNQYQGEYVVGRMVDDPQFVFQFHHCQSGSTQVSVGDIVGPGTPLCTEGSTGNSTGPHLHFQINEAGADDTKATYTHTIDPEPILREKGII